MNLGQHPQSFVKPKIHPFIRQRLKLSALTRHLNYMLWRDVKRNTTHCQALRKSVHQEQEDPNIKNHRTSANEHMLCVCMRRRDVVTAQRREEAAQCGRSATTL